MKKHPFRMAALVVAGLAAASAAQADDLIVNQHYLDYVGSAAIGTQFEAPALFNVVNQTAGNSFLAYCLEISQPALSSAVSYTSSAYTGSADVQELYDRFYGTAITDKTRAVAFQLALWDLAGGPATTAYTMVNVDGAQDLATSMVNAVKADGAIVPRQYQLTQWSNAAQQDVLQAAPVPEPATYALLLGGLGAIGMVVRRRNGSGHR